MTDQAVELPVALRVMDHQVVGPHGDLLGNVDDLVLSDDGGRLAVTGFLSGPPGLAARQPGRLGEWIGAVWRRLHPEQHPAPLVVPWVQVTRVAAAVTVTAWAEQALAEDMRLELWLRRHVVARLPGARGGEHRLGGLIATAARPRPELSLAPTDHLLSGLLGSVVIDDRGTELGTVLELVTRPAGARLDVERLVFGRRRLGAELGYTVDAEQGPWLVAAAVRAWHRGARQVGWDDVAGVDWDAGRVRLTPSARPRHPHAG